MIQALFARAGNQSNPKGRRGDSTGGQSQSDERTTLVSHQARPRPMEHSFPLPLAGSAVVRSIGAHEASGCQGTAKNQKCFLGQQEMENAWNEYLKLESDVGQLKQTLQEQHRRAFFFQVTQGLFLSSELCFLLRSPPRVFSFSTGTRLAPQPRLSLGDPFP